MYDTGIKYISKENSYYFCGPVYDWFVYLDKIVIMLLYVMYDNANLFYNIILDLRFNSFVFWLFSG